MISGWVHVRLKEKFNHIKDFKSETSDTINESTQGQKLTIVSPGGDVQNVVVTVIGETAYVKNLAASKQLNG